MLFSSWLLARLILKLGKMNKQANRLASTKKRIRLAIQYNKRGHKSSGQKRRALLAIIPSRLVLQNVSRVGSSVPLHCAIHGRGSRNGCWAQPQASDPLILFSGSRKTARITCQILIWVDAVQNAWVGCRMLVFRWGRGLVPLLVLRPAAESLFGRCVLGLRFDVVAKPTLRID